MSLIGGDEHANFDLCGAIIDQAADAIIFADRDGRVRIWNRGAEVIFGYAAAEILGRDLDVIIPEPFREAHWAGFHRAMETGLIKHNGRTLTTRSVHKNGSKLYLDLSFSLVRYGDGAVAGALALGRDCTVTHLAQRARDRQGRVSQETER